jgi:streptogramin lyase
MKRIFGLLFTAILLFSIVGSTALAQTPDGNMPQDLTYYFRRSWGGEADQIHAATDIVVSNNGEIYIAMDELDRILKISTADNTYTTFGKPGYGEGEIAGPRGLALAANGDVYVTNRGTRVSVFTSDGEYLKSWGSTGSGPGEFLGASGITIDQSGVVYVADKQNNRIQKFDLEGTYLGEISHNPGYPNRLNQPVDVAVDNSGNTYVVDGIGFTVEKYSPSGELIAEWGQVNAVSIDLDEQGHVYVMDTISHKIFQYTDMGQEIRNWEFEAYRNTYGGGIDFVDGYLYLAYSGNYFALKLNTDGSQNYRWGPNSPASEKFDAISGIAVDNQGRIIVADEVDHRIQVFNLDGSLLQIVTHENQENHMPFSPIDVAVDSDGYYYVVDAVSDQLFKFSPEWMFVDQWGTQGDQPGQLSFPMSLTVDQSGMVYVTDIYRDCVVKFNGSGEFSNEWCNNMGDITDMTYPYDITADHQGYIYVVDYFSKYIFKFNSEGSLISRFTPSPHSGQISGIDVDENGHIFVTDHGYSSIRELNPSGIILTTFGGYGSEPGQLRNPERIALGPDGQVIVADSGNLRMGVFTLTIPDSDPETGFVQNGTIERQLIEWSYGGDIGEDSVSISTDRNQGNYSMLLGMPVPQTEQGQSSAWAYSNFFIDPMWTRPILTFNYKMHVNDNMHYSDFLVIVQNGVGDRTERIVTRDGYLPCSGNYAPRPGRDLGWRTGSYDLSAFKGQHVRIVFSNRNLWPDSLGIWTNVDNVRVLDAGPIPPTAGPYAVNLPLISLFRCDIPDYTLQGGLERPTLEY